MDERHFIDMLGHAGENLADPSARFAVASKFERRLHDRADLLLEKAGVFVETGQLLSVTFFQLRLVLPRIDVARAAVHEQPNHAFDFGRKMASLWRERIERFISGRRAALRSCNG